MKFILPLLICLFISGCTLQNPSVQKKEITPKQKLLDKIEKTEEKNTDTIFSTKYDTQKEHVYSNLNNTIVDIANQLFHTRANHKSKTRVILTTFVDLDQLEKTSTFGRLISESMYNELHIRKFQVTDFRGREAVTVNENGSFHITRDVSELKDNIDAVEYILVGTYVKFEDQSLLINARILDSISGRIESSARVVYKPRDCSLFGICKKKAILEQTTQTGTVKTFKPKKMNQAAMQKINNSPIMIIKDN